MKAWADSTRGQDANQIGIYQEFFKKGRIKPYPTCEKTILAFIAFRARSVQYTTIAANLSAIAAAHMAIDKTVNLRTDAVYLTSKGVRRSQGCQSQQKAPITYEVLRKMKLPMISEDNGIRTCTVITLAWKLLLRKSELLAVEADDINFVTDKKVVLVTIPKSKTDQDRKGVILPVACTCPSKVCACCAPLFLKSNTKSRFWNKKVFKVSCATYLDKIRCNLKKIGKDPGEFGTHSCRRGGAQFYKSKGFSDEQVKKLGGWSLTSRAFQVYLQHTVEIAQQMANAMKTAQFNPNKSDIDLTHRPRNPGRKR